MKRQIFLDIETTGLYYQQGHRVIEIAAMEMIDRKLTGNNFHTYINPQRVIEKEAINIHKIQNDFLLDKPLFEDIANKFLGFISKSELIIHNASFDLGFLDNELKMISHQYGRISDNNAIIDSLKVAREKHPGKKNSLDALCKRYNIDYAERQIKGHGALLDSKILYEVYISMTSEQMSFIMEKKEAKNTRIKYKIKKRNKPLIIIKAMEEELIQHNNFFLSH